MQPIWRRLAAMHLNTVVASVAWETIEPQDGKFDFGVVDGLIAGAHKHDLRLVFLWFGSWKMPPAL
jgi:beta-galactosidase GanA